MIPVFFLQIWLIGAFSFGLVGGFVYFACEWYERATKWDALSQRPVFAPDFGANGETLFLAGAVFLGLVASAGASILKALPGDILGSADDGESDPRHTIPADAEERLTRPDGTVIKVGIYGPEDGIPVVCTHGWSLTSEEWNCLVRELAGPFRLIVWDLPGLGASTCPPDKNFTIDRFAGDLEAVLELAEGRPAFLLGHSIGGMIILKFCELYPEAASGRVAGLVLAHTTHTNPVRTASGAALLTALEKPVLEPLMWGATMMSPLISLITWLSYRNGSLHLMMKQLLFAGTETRKQIDFSARFQVKASPSVLARGMLGMMRYDATPVLESIAIPTLIIAGDEDTGTKPAASERIHAGISGSRLVVLSPARHMGLIEHHKEFAETVREFILSSANKPL